MLKTNGINFLLVIFLVCNCQRGNAESPVIAYTEFGEIKLQEFIDDYQEFLTFTGVEDNLLFRNGMLKSEIDRLFLLKYANDSEFTKKEYVAKKIENSIGQTLLNEYYTREIEAGFQVPPELVREAFRRSKIELHARHLYAKSMEEALALKHRLDHGETFEALAKEVFTSPQLADSGGDLGYFTFNEMDPAFENVAYSLKDGEISDPVQTNMGYSIIQVLDRNIEPFITEYDYQVHREDFVTIIKSRLLKDEVRQITNDLAKLYEPIISIEDMNKIFQHLDEIFNDMTGIPDELSDISLKSGNTRWNCEEICSHLRETTPNQRKQVQSTDDLFDMLTGLCVREEIFNKIESSKWRASEELNKKIKDAKEQRIIKLLMADMYSKLNTGKDSVNQKEAYFSFIKELKENAMINIDDKLLKSFSL